MLIKLNFTASTAAHEFEITTIVIEMTDLLLLLVGRNFNSNGCENVQHN
jgi:hypothetical protein